MPTGNRRRWMRDYMREYRQGKLRGDAIGEHLHPGNSNRHAKLKEAHRLDSFKWRLSQLLSPQYEILLCVEYAPRYGVFEDDEGMIMGCNQELVHNSKEVMHCFPTLKDEFKGICDTGGSELFKALLLWKYSKKFDQVTESIVGVLDKAALLKDLQKLPSQGGSKWKPVLNKVKTDWRQNTSSSRILLLPAFGTLLLNVYTNLCHNDVLGRGSC